MNGPLYDAGDGRDIKTFANPSQIPTFPEATVYEILDQTVPQRLPSLESANHTSAVALCSSIVLFLALSIHVLCVADVRKLTERQKYRVNKKALTETSRSSALVKCAWLQVKIEGHLRRFVPRLNIPK